MYSNKMRRQQGFNVSHREYVCDVVAPAGGAFSYLAFALNPGIETSFPWLSQIAACFEQYRLNSMNVHYVSTSADALTGSNTALGSIILGCDYNAANPPFSSKNQMENSAMSISGKPSQDIRMPINPHSSSGAPFQNHFVRGGSTLQNQDIRFYDIGLIQIATVGGQQTGTTSTVLDPYTGVNITGSAIGELWFEYSFTFFKPVLDNDVGSKLSYAHIINGKCESNALKSTGNMAVITVPFGGPTGTLTRSYNSLYDCYPTSNVTTPNIQGLHDDFGLLIQVDTPTIATPALAQYLVFPAGSASGSLLITLTFIREAGTLASTAIAKTTIGGPQLVGSWYPRTTSASDTGIQLINYIGNEYPTMFCNSGTDAGLYEFTYLIYVAITNPSVDNWVKLGMSAGVLTEASTSSFDLCVHQISALTKPDNQ